MDTNPFHNPMKQTPLAGWRPIRLSELDKCPDDMAFIYGTQMRRSQWAGNSVTMHVDRTSTSYFTKTTDPVTVELLAPKKGRSSYTLPKVGDVLWDSEKRDAHVVHRIEYRRNPWSHRKDAELFLSGCHILIAGKNNEKKFWRRYSVIGHVDIEKKMAA